MEVGLREDKKEVADKVEVGLRENKMEVADKMEVGCGKPLALRAELILPDSSLLLSVAATILILCNLDTRTSDTAATLHCV